VLCELTPIALDRSSGRDPVGRSSRGIRAKRDKNYKSINKNFVDAIGGPQSIVRPSLYRPRVVFSDLESCCPRNKGFGDKF
jgi:hypothetical protein